MGNTIWFILLAGLSLLLIAFTFWKKKDFKLLALFLGLGAIAGYFENVICIWLQSYEYYPKILENPYLDLVLGTYLSQVYYVTSVALFITAFRLKFNSAACFYRLHWAIFVCITLAIWTSYFAFIHLNILTFKYLWCVWLFASADIVVPLCCCKLNQELTKPRLP
ncbi:MAG: hypothetical protein K0S39_5996 [Paenibacillus sp.]|jgi:hypothetical protein|nr:hypothetical protein [Paenibacillus sp.]